jgi:hypothetical protein
MEIKKSQKIPNFCCEKCAYITNNKKDYIKHTMTSKHADGNDLELFGNEKSQYHVCECKKKYKTYSGLWKHKKICILKIQEIPNLTNLVLEVIKQNQELINQNTDFQKQNQELQKGVIDVIKNGTTNINTLNNNSHNKTFNLQLFLNETCKDAMNIMDFVDSIKIQLADIESIGELGFVNGISKLIIKNLKALDENMRPVHCSDQKRESLYVKDGNVWEKEDADNKKMRKAIKYIAHNNICALPLWRAKYPDHSNSESKRSDQYNYIMMEAMGGAGDNDEEKAEKIIKKISKEVLINKN